MLNLLIAGFYRVKNRKGFLQPPSAVNAFNTWLSNANVVARFIEEACEQVDASKFEHTTSQFFDALRHYCDEEKVQRQFQPTLSRMKQRLESLGYRIAHTNVGSGVFGLRLKESWKKKMGWQWSDNTELDDTSSMVRVTEVTEFAGPFIHIVKK